MSREIALERIKFASENNHRVLDLSHLHLVNIPSEITELINLQYLFLEHNQITDIDILRPLKNLKIIGLSHNQITVAPAFLLDLNIPFLWKDSSNLLLASELALSHVLAPALNEAIRQALVLALARDKVLSQVLGKALYQSIYQSSELAQSLVDRAEPLTQNLNHIRAINRDLAREKDCDLSKVLDRARTLNRELHFPRDLDISIEIIKPLITNLSQDLEIAISSNFLESSIMEDTLSWVIGKLIDLQSIGGIYLRNNRLKSPSIELILQGNNAIRVFFNEPQKKHLSLNEVKVILVGEGGSGKTSLVKRLRKKKFDKNESQTHGIRISRQDFTFQKQSFLVNFWDFGGQEIMHATHQFFLTKRCLYILVLDSRKDEKAEYWLNYIESFGGTSPVVIVLNKIDENPSFNINRSFLSKKYPNIKGYYRVSCNNGDGLRDLKKDLAQYLWNLELREYVLPQSWVNIKKALENMQEDFIDYAHYQKICREYEVKAGSSQKVLLELLNDLGVVFNYETLRLLDTQVLNPLWLTNAVYRIINSPILVQSSGRFNINDLNVIINDEYYQKENHEHWHNSFKTRKREQNFPQFPEAKFLFIVEIMKQFEILFQLDDLHYLVPALLPDEEKAYLFTKRGNILHFMIEYGDFLPSAIIPRFMVKLHKYIYRDQRWKTGMVLEEKTLFNSIAKIVLDKEIRKIYIEVVGERSRDFLSVIRETIREINSSYQNLNVIEWVPLPDEYKNEPVMVKYRELKGYEKANQEQFFSGELMKSFPVANLLNEIEKPELRHGLQPCHIFVSYSQQDQKYKEKLIEHLSPLFRLNRASLWDDSCIDAGDEWRQEIFSNLEKAHIVLCLISSSFIDSDFCYTEELTRALDAHDQGKKVVIPIRLKEVNWRQLKISELQGLPKNKWIRNLSDHKSWTEIAKGVEAAIDKITKGK